jgi:cyclic beta-1,2-glucan synthetase
VRADPVDAYGRMDFASRDAYRHVIERVARHAGCPETTVARHALDMAEQAALRPAGGDGHERHAHVGLYLLGAGRRGLEEALGIRRRWSPRGSPGVLACRLYLGIALVLSVPLSVGPLSHSAQVLQLPGAAVLAMTLLLLLGRLQVARALLNWMVTLFVPTQALPRMDYAHGIPSESRTLVVVATLLGSAEVVESMVTPWSCAFWPTYRQTQADADDNDVEPFLLLHWPRRWNAGEGVWMGHERKRGATRQP